jgi:hypothetical protein
LIRLLFNNWQLGLNRERKPKIRTRPQTSRQRQKQKITTKTSEEKNARVSSWINFSPVISALFPLRFVYEKEQISRINYERGFMNQIKLLKKAAIAAGFSLSLAIAAHAQSDIETPYTGKVSCQQILKLGMEGTTDYYEKKLNAETKWAIADCNRCKYNQNFAGLKKLSTDKQKIVEKLRDALESYFTSFYTMQTITVGGGEPFELDVESRQSDVEDLIGKAVLIYSKLIVLKPVLRKQAEAHLSKAEKRLPELTKMPEAKDFGWLDATNEDDRETIKNLQADYKKAAGDFHQSIKDFRALIKNLPDSLVNYKWSRR